IDVGLFQVAGLHHYFRASLGHAAFRQPQQTVRALAQLVSRRLDQLDLAGFELSAARRGNGNGAIGADADRPVLRNNQGAPGTDDLQSVAEQATLVIDLKAAHAGVGFVAACVEYGNETATANTDVEVAASGFQASR